MRFTLASLKHESESDDKLIMMDQRDVERCLGEWVVVDQDIARQIVAAWAGKMTSYNLRGKQGNPIDNVTFVAFQDGATFISAMGFGPTQVTYTCQDGSMIVRKNILPLIAIGAVYSRSLK